MFGFQRVGDLIWQAADARTRGLPARRHRRAHDAARRGSAAPGRPLARARVHGAAVPGVRPGVRLRGGHDRASRACSGCTATAEPNGGCDRDVFYYLTLYNENYEMPAMPEHVQPADVMRGLYRWSAAPADGHAGRAVDAAVQRLGAGRGVRGGRRPRRRTTTSASSCGRPRRTRRCATRRWRPSGGTACTRARSRGSARDRAARRQRRHRSSPSPTS